MEEDWQLVLVEEASVALIWQRNLWKSEVWLAWLENWSHWAAWLVWAIVSVFMEKVLLNSLVAWLKDIIACY